MARSKIPAHNKIVLVKIWVKAKHKKVAEKEAKVIEKKYKEEVA